MKKWLIGLTVCAAYSSPLVAQVGAPNGSGVAMGHVHMNVQDVEAHGMNLTYGIIPEGGTTPVQTKSRVLDHIGFEVTDLETFARTLEANGVTLDTPYQRDPELGISSVFLTDPWGVTIELTEGLRTF